MIANEQSMAKDKYIKNVCGIKKEKSYTILIKCHMTLINMY